MARFSELVELYKSNGLSPLEAVTMARQEQGLERDLRLRERQMEAEQSQLAKDKEDNRIQEEKRIEIEKLKWEAERAQLEREKQMQFEAEKLRLEAERLQKVEMDRAK